MKNLFRTSCLTTTGWALSFLWLVFIVYLLLTHEFPNDLNSIGDFVAGMASPLAFLWVVIGYYQSQEALKLQAKELSQSSEALVHQVEEMRAATKLQEEQLKQVKLQYENSISNDKFKLQPFFDLRLKRIIEIEEIKGSYLSLTFELECIEGSARYVSLYNKKHNIESLNPINLITKGKVEKIQIHMLEEKIDSLFGTLIQVNYFDVKNNYVSQEYMININEQIKEMVFSQITIN